MNFFRQEKNFLLLFTLLVCVIAFTFQIPQIAMWMGVTLAMLSVVGNDSIQTLGTFLTSNKDRPWWVLWIFLASIFVAILTYGWYQHGGDVSYGRLKSVQVVTEFNFFHIFAPAFLVLLTHFRIPVSTTFLVLSVFSTSSNIHKMLSKTFAGYIIAFLVALILWGVMCSLFGPFFEKKLSKKEEKIWRFLQWGATGFLWSTWVMHDIANVAVFLPREISGMSLTAFLLIGCIGLGFILYKRGGNIQRIVTEKQDVTEVRSATLIDLVLAIILIFLKEWNNIPMSTTWVFLGLLAGREIILVHVAQKSKQYKKTLRLVLKDVGLALFGLVVSVLLAFLSQG